MKKKKNNSAWILNGLCTRINWLFHCIFILSLKYPHICIEVYAMMNIPLHVSFFKRPSMSVRYANRKRIPKSKLMSACLEWQFDIVCREVCPIFTVTGDARAPIKYSSWHAAWAEPIYWWKTVCAVFIWSIHTFKCRISHEKKKKKRFPVSLGKCENLANLEMLLSW